MPGPGPAPGTGLRIVVVPGALALLFQGAAQQCQQLQRQSTEDDEGITAQKR